MTYYKALVKEEATKKIQIFKCVPKNVKRNFHMKEEQGIIFTNGCCKIGIDVWRDLNKHDCSSHPFRSYNSLNEALKHYQIISTNVKTKIS